MTFERVAAAADVPTGKMIGVKANGKTVLIANVAGKLHAIADSCTHAHCALSRGTLEGAAVTCPCHSSKFDVRTGKVIAGPAKLNELAFNVKVEGKQIFVDA